MDSVSEHAIESNLNNNLLLPPKPVRQPNPVYRKSRRGRNPGKQFERSTNNKELLRTKAFLTNTTSHDKVLAYNKTYVSDEEEEWITQSDKEEYHSVLHEKGKQEFEMSIQKPAKNYYKKGNKKSSHIDRENKECYLSRSSSHMIYMQDIIETRDSHKQKLQTSTSNCKSFIRFCSRELICPQENRAALAVKLYGVQAALLSGLGNPFENLSQSISSRSNNNSHALILSLRQASTGFLPAIIWTGMFTMSFVYTVIVVWSLDFRVPIISVLCLSLLYCLSLLVAAASEFNVMCSMFRINGILFASLGVLSFVLLLFVLVMLLLFLCWWRTNQGVGKK